jgi:hypothetical protein
MGVYGAIIDGATQLLKQSTASTAGQSRGLRLRLTAAHLDFCEVALHA